MASQNKTNGISKLVFENNGIQFNKQILPSYTWQFGYEWDCTKMDVLHNFTVKSGQMCTFLQKYLNWSVLNKN